MAALTPPAAAASWRKLRIGMPRDDEYDAVIVGGGIGGVAAARRLLEAGKRVCLLEAQDRWGGRTKHARSSAVPGVTVDVGGQWVGPSHTRLLELLRTLGLPLVRQYGRGADLLDDGQQIRKSLNLGTNSHACPCSRCSRCNSS